MEHQLELSADADSSTVTTSSSQLETVHPFSAEEDSPRSEEDPNELLPRDLGDSNRHSSLQTTPAAADLTAITATSAGASTGSQNSNNDSAKAWRSSNQQSHNCDVSSSSDERGTYSFSSPPSSNLISFSTSSAEADQCRLADSSVSSDYIRQTCTDLATNQSVISPDFFASYTRRHGSGHLKSSSNIGSAESSEPMDSSKEPAEADEGLLMGNSNDETNLRDRDGVTSTDAGSESPSTNEDGQNDSVFANLGENTEATSLSDGATEKSSAPRLSLARMNKNELANLIEKTILDFCSSRTVETMRRMFAGVTNDSEALLRDGGRHDDKSASTPHPVTGELVKEGIIIGDLDVFAPRMQREFILPVKDSLIANFLREPGVFRAICYRTRCQVEVTRRLLNRKLCTGGRWHKYMIIRIAGPTYRSIDNCDTLLQRAVPNYKLRKTYNTAATCRMFLREDVPDNADLYFNFQRTGGSSHRFGALKLDSPFRSTPRRSCSESPWKYGLFKMGKLPFSTPAVKLCMKLVYPSMGYQSTFSLEPEYIGASATDRISSLHEQFQMNRQAAMTLKRSLTIPVCR